MSDENKYKTITVSEELYQKLDRLRQRKVKLLGLKNLSWNEFLNTVEDSIRESVKDGTSTK